MASAGAIELVYPGLLEVERSAEYFEDSLERVTISLWRPRSWSWTDIGTDSVELLESFAFGSSLVYTEDALVDSTPWRDCDTRSFSVPRVLPIVSRANGVLKAVISSSAGMLLTRSGAALLAALWPFKLDCLPVYNESGISSGGRFSCPHSIIRAPLARECSSSCIRCLVIEEGNGHP